jgi:hypothetical protein
METSRAIGRGNWVQMSAVPVTFPVTILMLR